MASEKIDRRQKRSKAAFAAAFRELLIEKEFSRITVKEIAERADRDRKTFYLHYESIDDLVDELLKDEIERIVNAIGAASLDDGGRIDVAMLFEVLSEELVSSFNQSTSVMKYIDTDRMIMRLRPMLTQAIVERDSLGLAETLGPYLEPFVAYFCAGLLGLYHQWASSESELPMERLAELAGATIAGGIAELSAAAGGNAGL